MRSTTTPIAPTRMSSPDRVTSSYSALTARTPQKTSTIRLGILGTGGMARQHAEFFQKIDGCEVAAAADVDLPKAQTFCARHGIPQALANLDQLLAIPALDAISIAVPDSLHAEMSIRCLNAGKHVFCEKPLATSTAEGERMWAAAQQSKCVHMVNFSFRNLPAVNAIADLVRSGKIGAVKHVEGCFLQSWLTATIDGGWQASPPLLWRLSTEHGSKGVLGDVGVHLLDLATYVVAPISQISCRLKTYPKAPANRIGEYFLDANDSAAMTVEFANGAMGILHTTRWAAGKGNQIALKIYGTLGGIEFDTDFGPDIFKVCSGKDLHSQIWKTNKASPCPSTYERFICAIQSGESGCPDFADGLAIQIALEACFQSDATSTMIPIDHPGEAL